MASTGATTNSATVKASKVRNDIQKIVNELVKKEIHLLLEKEVKVLKCEKDEEVTNIIQEKCSENLNGSSSSTQTVIEHSSYA